MNYCKLQPFQVHFCLMKRSFRLLTTLILLSFAISTYAQDEKQSAGLQFQRAYSLLSGGDDARDSGDIAAAIDMYSKALGAYKSLSDRYPAWQPNVVKFRVAYCETQLESLVKDLAASPVKKDPASPKKDPVAPKKEPNLKMLKKTAADLIVSGDTKKARELLLDALLIDPDDFDIRLMIGMVQCRDSEFINAVDMLGQLVKEDASNAVANVTLGTALFGLGQIDDAE